MKNFFQDTYINQKILTRLTREIKAQQLYQTINEINHLNEVQSKIITSNDINVSNQELEFVQKVRDAKRNL